MTLFLIIIFSIRKKGRENNDCVFKTVRDYKRYDQDMFENLLQSKDWNIFRDYDDPNLQWDFIYRNVIDILSIMCPYKVISARKVPTPWITPEIYNMIKEKRALTKTYKATRDRNDLQLLRVHRNKVISTINSAKATYIVQSLHRTCKNPKQFWRIIKYMIDPSEAWDIETVNFVDPITMNTVLPSDKPNDFFAKIAGKTCDFSKIERPILNNINDAEIKFDFQPPDLDDLMYLIREIDVNTSSCVQGINMKMCKRIITMIPDKFLLLFANSMFKEFFLQNGLSLLSHYCRNQET